MKTIYALLILSAFLAGNSNLNAAYLHKPDGISGVFINSFHKKCNGELTPVSVSLLSFDYAEHTMYTELQWSTETEKNNFYFLVEYAENGRDFRKLAEVPAAGFTTAIKTYSLKDTVNYGQAMYYRLSRVDENGETVSIGLLYYKGNSDPENQLLIYPNPSENGNEIEIKSDTPDKEMKITMFDLSGNEIYSAEGVGKIEISDVDLLFRQGFYILNISTDNGVFINKKMIIIN